MMASVESRRTILDGIRRALGGPNERDRTSTAPPSVIPARAALDPAGQKRLFVEMAEQSSATVGEVSTITDVPRAVADFLAEHALPRHGVVAAEFGNLPWAECDLDVRCGRGEDGDPFSLTGAFASIAETGTLMLLSGPGSPTTLNFLPEAHIVALARGDIVGTYEDAWARMDAKGIDMPRAVNLITGPSRTADIEQTMQFGAHGPRHLHVVLINEQP